MINDTSASTGKTPVAIPGLLLHAASVFAFLTVVLGIVYPIAVTGVARVVFPDQAQGSLVREEGKVIGSALIGQDWSGTGLFMGRPSTVGYDAMSSGGSNQALSNLTFQKDVLSRAKAWREKVGGNAVNTPVPQVLLTASGSGLDPDLPIEAVRYQIPYVARSTGLSEEILLMLAEETSREDFLAFGASPLVNVLELNCRVVAELGITMDEWIRRTKEAVATR